MAVLAEQEEKAAGVREQGMVEFMFHVLRSDIGGLRSELGKLSERQDTQFKELLERQDAQFKDFLERQDTQFKKLLERQDAQFKELLERQDTQFKELLKRQDVQFKDLLERQDQTFVRLEEKIDRRIDGLYHVVIWVLVTALGSVAMGILGLVLR